MNKVKDISDGMLRSWHLMVGVVLMPLMVQAVIITSWTNSNSGAWETGANWRLGVAPSNNAVYVTNALSKTVTISSSTSSDFLSQSNVYVEAPVGYTNTLLLSGNTSSLALIGTPALSLGETVGKVGSIIMNEGWLVTSNGGLAYVGRLGSGMMTVQSGNWIGYSVYVGDGSGSKGKLELLGGTNTFIYNQFAFIVGNLAGSVGEVDMAGGLLVVSNNSSAIGYSGVGTMNLSGGTWLVNGLIVGDLAGSSGTLNLSGSGVMTTYYQMTFGAISGSTGTVVMTGGLLNATNSNKDIVIGNSGIGIMTVSNGTWLANRAAVGFNSPTNGAPAKGTLTIAGGEVRTKGTAIAGSVVGASNNTILVTGGLLDVDTLSCPNGGGNIISNAGGIYQFFTATPVITTNGGPVVLNGGTISFRDKATVDVKGNQTGSQLTNMTFTTGGQNAFRLNNATNNTTPVQSYTFASNLGATNYVRLELVNGSTGYRGGSVTLGAGGSLLVSNTLATFINPLTNNSASIMMAGPSTIKAGSNVVWMAGSTATTTVGLVTFDSGTTNVLSSGTVDFCQLAGATQAVSGVVAGAGSLVKSGPGVLILSGSNTYSGATGVSNGTLQVNGSIHSSAVSLSGSGTLVGTGTVYGAVSGTGRIIATITNDSGGALYMTVSGTLDVSGATLSVLDPGNNLAASGSTYIVARFTPGGLTGTFVSNDLPTGWLVRYNNGAGTIQIARGHPGTLIKIQ